MAAGGQVAGRKAAGKVVHFSVLAAFTTFAAFPFVWMLITLVNFEFCENCPPQTIVRDHTLDRMFNQELRSALPSVFRGL